MPYANPHDKRNWNKADVHKMTRPCSKCGAPTQFRSGVCRQCTVEANREKEAKRIAASFGGFSRTMQDHEFDAREICPHPLASRMPRWKGKWCGLCNREVGNS